MAKLRIKDLAIANEKSKALYLRDFWASSPFLTGFRDSLAVAPSVAAYAALAGMLSAKHGINLLATLGFDLLMFAGGAQIVIAKMWMPGISIGEILIAVFIINFRYCLIGASLKDIFHGSGWKESLAKVHLVADENWAVTISKANEIKENSAHFLRNHLFGGGICILFFWIIATVLGHELGSFIDKPEELGLDFAFASVFTAMVVLMYDKKQENLPWLIALASSCLAFTAFPGQKWYIAIGGLCGATTQLFLHEIKKHTIKKGR